jgi:glucose uptake protein GlcU
MKELPDEKPPFFKSWNSWYAMVIGFLALLIILFYLFTKHFS